MILLGGWYRNVISATSKAAYPAGLWKLLAGQMPTLSAYFDGLQLPPASLAQGGSGVGCDGYEVFEYRNLNGTRWGSQSDLQNLIHTAHQHKMKVWGDLPFHQMGGSNGGPGVFKYENGVGNLSASQFQGNFQPIYDDTGKITGYKDSVPPFAPQDEIPSTDGDYPFGYPRAYQNAVPAGSVEEDAREILALYTGLGFDGFRWDDVKATHQPSVKRIMDSQAQMAFYGEYFDGNPANLNWWAKTLMGGRSAVEDFTLHWRLQAACNGFDATLFDQGGAGYWQWNSSLAIGFVDNPDTDTSPGQQVIFNKGIAYALMLNLPLRAAIVYQKDYAEASSDYPECYGLQKAINNLCWISRKFAFGGFHRVWVDRDVYAYLRDGHGGSLGWSGGLLVAVNFNVLVSRTITVGGLQASTLYHDYTGHSDDVWSDGEGRVTVTIPSNAYSNGMSYVCLAVAGVK